MSYGVRSPLFVVAADSAPSLEQAKTIMSSDSYKNKQIDVCFTGGMGVRAKVGRRTFDYENKSNDLYHRFNIPACTYSQKARFDDVGADVRYLNQPHFLVTSSDQGVLGRTWTKDSIDEYVSRTSGSVQISKSKWCGANIDPTVKYAPPSEGSKFDPHDARYRATGFAAANGGNSTKSEDACKNLCKTLPECASSDTACKSTLQNPGKESARCWCKLDVDDCLQEKIGYGDASLEEEVGVNDALLHPQFAKPIKDEKVLFSTTIDIPKIGPQASIFEDWQRMYSNSTECESLVGTFYSPRLPDSIYHTDGTRHVGMKANMCYTSEHCTDHDSFCRPLIYSNDSVRDNPLYKVAGTCMTDVDCQVQNGGNGMNGVCKRIEKNDVFKKQIVHSLLLNSRTIDGVPTSTCQFFPDMLAPDNSTKINVDGKVDVKGAWYYGLSPSKLSDVETQLDPKEYNQPVSQNCSASYKNISSGAELGEKTLDDCKEACDASAECNGFVRSETKKRCVLKTDYGLGSDCAKNNDGEDYAWYSRKALKNYGGIFASMHKDSTTDYKKYDKKDCVQIKNVSTDFKVDNANLDDCKTACDSNSECNGFVRSDKEKTCTLKTFSSDQNVDICNGSEKYDTYKNEIICKDWLGTPTTFRDDKAFGGELSVFAMKKGEACFTYPVDDNGSSGNFTKDVNETYKYSTSATEP